VIENVATLATSNRGADLAAILEAIEAAGYRHRHFIVDAVHFVPQSRERIFIIAARRAIPDMPPMPHRNTTLADVVDFDAPCRSPAETARLVGMMAPRHLANLDAAKAEGRRMALAGCRRTRSGVQRIELRDDGIAGAVRTAAGGSSLQDLVFVDGVMVKSRKIIKREAARLMGLPESYRLPSGSSEAFDLIGDGVVVPVVAFLEAHVVRPLVIAAETASASKRSARAVTEQIESF
jgi:DNA (cytosine-5)-methyltransferase 1